MKHLLNKKLSVKQVLVLVAVLLAIVITIFKLTIGNPSNPLHKKIFAKRHSPKFKKQAIDTSAMGMLTSYVDSMNNAGQLFGGSWSFYLAEVNSGKAICKVDIDHGLAPASVMKIVTTGTALSLLGPGYRFTTLIQYDGTLDSIHRILNGNIYIKGGGDPSLGAETFGSSISSVMKDWATAIKKAKIDSITGCIIGDAESFDANPISPYWTWEDMQCDYGTGPCGLNIHENLFNLLISATGPHDTKLKIDPPIPGLRLYNEVAHNPNIARSYVYVSGAPYEFERTAFGEVSSYFEGKSAIPDPPLFCAQSLRAALKENGVKVGDSATTMRLIHLNHVKTGKKAERKIITTTLSPPLTDLVYHTNQVSQNFYAESILRELAWKINGFGNSSNAVSIIYHFWKEHGLDLRGICMVDGCGLARMDAITTHQLVDMLRVYAKDSSVFPTFYRSLPVAGETGTIRKLASGTEADDNLHAKSGTMARIKSYAGYVKTRGGTMLCFAMIGNNTLWSEEELRDKFARLFVLMARLP